MNVRGRRVDCRPWQQQTAFSHAIIGANVGACLMMSMQCAAVAGLAFDNMAYFGGASGPMTNTAKAVGALSVVLSVCYVRTACVHFPATRHSGPNVNVAV
jgi:hypothetical protein